MKINNSIIFFLFIYVVIALISCTRQIPPDTFVDSRDGKVYKTVLIGDQVWLAGNLNYDAGSGCYSYGDDSSNGDKLGRLYNWEAARRAVPKGWHLPGKEEYEVLLSNFDSYEPRAYKELIPGGYSEFDALFGGFREKKGNYGGKGESAYFWTYTENDDDEAWYFSMKRDKEMTVTGYGDKSAAFSVRLVKDRDLRYERPKETDRYGFLNDHTRRFRDPRDGKIYKTATIGDQVWMAENLNFETDSGSWCDDHGAVYIFPGSRPCFGRLYNWETANLAAPPGWHLPSKSEYDTLLSRLGGKGHNAYHSIITGGSSGFNVREFRYYVSFWSSTKIDSNSGWYLSVSFEDGYAFMDRDNRVIKRSRLPVRLVRDRE